MKSIEIYEGAHQWIMFGRDDHKLEKIIDSNQYMVRTPNRCLLLEPGGMDYEFHRLGCFEAASIDDKIIARVADAVALLPRDATQILANPFDQRHIPPVGNPGDLPGELAQKWSRSDYIACRIQFQYKGSH